MSSDNNLIPPRLPVPDGFERGMARIRQFCQDFSEQDVQSSLSKSLKACVTSDIPDFADAEDRQDIYYVFEHLAQLMHAVYLLGTASHLILNRLPTIPTDETDENQSDLPYPTGVFPL
ncbi:hypothetical protein GCM10011511_11680 [Puia dinghuensis]|uniref:Uncharacterized protein n=1 Tax=Puia dinghuensis TaxID=1792502 RepID=A0A8J2UAQ2_9BACT|nr:hypothetical protein GCM10011511_11680 [Puia dinghuensis]